MFCVLFAALIVLGGITSANATIWDAFTDFTTADTQSSTSIWQFLTAPAGTTTYTPMPTRGGGWYDDTMTYSWRANDSYTAYFAKFDGGVHALTDLRADHGDPNLDTVLGWCSPIDGVVDISFQVRKQIGGGTGVNYYLYEEGNATALSSGAIDGYGDSGMITLPSLSVTVGRKFYLQMDPAGDPNTDTLGCNMTVTTVPEPGTVVLLCGAFAGLAIFFRRNRK
jgi:hypothetical protein